MAALNALLARAEQRLAVLLRPVLRQWERVPVHVQGTVLVMLPIVAVILSSGVAFVGNGQRARIEAALQRHLTFARDVNTVMTLMVNAETGMRGYLLTSRADFLEPYARAEADLAGALTDLREVAASEPGDGPRQRKVEAVEQLSALIDEQMADLSWQRQYLAGTDPSGDEITRHLALGKQLMDEIRSDIAQLQSEEERLLLERLEEINAIRARDYVAIFLTLLVGLVTRVIAWFLFNRGVTRRIERMVSYLRALKRAEDAPFVPSGKHDAIGDLEHEVADIGPFVPAEAACANVPAAAPGERRRPGGSQP